MVHISRLEEYLNEQKKKIVEKNRPLTFKEIDDIISVIEKFLDQVEYEHDNIRDKLNKILSIIEKSRKGSSES